MIRPSDDMLAYLDKVGNEYKPHRHRTIVLHMVKRFAIDEADADDAVRYWLASREAQTVN